MDRQNAWSWLVLLALLFTALGLAGLLLVRAANRAPSDAELVATWAKTTGRLRELRFSPEPGLKYAGYRVTASYTFRAANRDYTGHGLLGPTTAATLPLLKQQWQMWFIDPGARTTTSQGLLGEEFTYTPLGQDVPVYFNPSNPTASYFGAPSATPPRYPGPMRWLGAALLVLGAGGFAGITMAARSKWKDDRARRAVLIPAEPTTAEQREFTERIDAAILAVKTAIRDDPGLAHLHSVAESLRALRANPAEALRATERFGFNRWLSGEMALENSGPLGRGVLAATDAVEAFHRHWRKAHAAPARTDRVGD
ncbi:MAG: DUF3592 domain-containing protein [Opitutaceae bacterium]|nr:DUF3592 domain-containing protein [Opitutaceae bacterium]